MSSPGRMTSLRDPPSASDTIAETMKMCPSCESGSPTTCPHVEGRRISTPSTVIATSPRTSVTRATAPEGGTDMVEPSARMMFRMCGVRFMKIMYHHGATNRHGLLLLQYYYDEDGIILYVFCEIKWSKKEQSCPKGTMLLFPYSHVAFVVSSQLGQTPQRLLPYPISL